MALLQYKNHYAGSGKGYVHQAFDLKGPKAALAKADKLGLALATARNWISEWRKPKATKASAKKATKKVSKVAAKKTKAKPVKKAVTKKTVTKKAKAPKAAKSAAPKKQRLPRAAREPKAPMLDT
jgi:hypothetical protein